MEWYAWVLTALFLIGALWAGVMIVYAVITYNRGTCWQFSKHVDPPPRKKKPRRRAR